MFDLITLNSEIISVALEPTMCAPKILPSLPTSILMNPSVAPTATAFPLEIKNDLATLKSIPSSSSCCSVDPIDATSGLEYVQAGTLL